MHHSSMDAYSWIASPVHRLDARAKLVAALVFTGAAVSEPRTEFVGLLPYLVPPLAAILVSGVPLRFIVKRVLIVSPFALVAAGLNLLFEKEPVTVTAGQWSAEVRLGLVTGGSILLKFLVSVSALLALATTTRMARLAGALASLGAPRALAMQVAFIYRYLFVVVDEFERRRRAADARTVGPIGLGTRVAAAGSQLGGLFARSLERAERVTAAMCARGFDGRMVRAPDSRMRIADWAFLILAVALVAAIRLRAPVSAFLEGPAG
ncbi:MAG: cobalt ECF transporter T component CbiQ [Planctomycetota bacterium]